MSPTDKIQLLNISDKMWREFVNHDYQINIFHNTQWIELIAEFYGFKPFVIAICDRNGDIRAGIPVVDVNSFLTGRRWISLPFSDHCNPLYKEESDLIQLSKELDLLSRKQKTIPIELRGKYSLNNSMITNSNHVLSILKLDPDPDKKYNQFHSMHKRNLKKAQKSGLRIEMSTSQEKMDRYYQLHLHNRKRQGIPVQPKKFFNQLRKKILEQGFGFILLAYLEDECIAANIFLHWGQTLTYKYGASNPERLDLRPNNLLMWEGIRWGCENGYRILDLGRTSISNVGLRNFKNKWGAKETPLPYAILPARSYSSPNKRIERVMHSIIRNSPSWVCRVSGELFYKHFA